MICGVFPGQGGQRKGMGRGMYEDPRTRRARGLYDLACEISGVDISGISFDGTAEEQSDPVNSQLITAVNSYVIYDSVKDKVDFDVFGGYSLGEMTALCAAGVFGKGDDGFRNMVSVVHNRGKIMKKYAFDRGCMVMVRECERDEVEKFCKSTKGGLVVALYCSSTTHVIGGRPKNIREYRDKFPGKSNVLENVKGPYHTGHYKDAAIEFRDFLGGVRLRKPRVPVVANRDGKPYTAENIIDNMVNQLWNPVLWDKCVRNMGAGTYIEMGSGKFLTRLGPEILEGPGYVSIQGLRDLRKV